MARQRSLRSQLLLLEAVIAIPLLLLWAWHAWLRWDHEQREAGDSVLRLARLAAASGSQLYEDGAAILDRMAERPLVRDPGDTCDPIFREFAGTSPRFTGLALFGADGRLRCAGVSGSPASRLSYADSSEFRALAAGETLAVTPPIRGRISGEWVVVLLRGLRAPDGTFRGALAIAIHLSRYQAILTDARMPDRSAISVLDPRGLVVARTARAVDEPNWIGRDVSEAEVMGITRARAEGHAIARGLDGLERIYGFTSIPGLEWKVVVGIPTATLLGPVRAELLRGGLIGLGLILVMGALTVRLARNIEGPVRGLAASTQRVMAGHYDQPIPVTGPREIAEVAGRFNRMLEVRRHAEQERLRLERELREREVMSAMGALVSGVAHEVRSPLFGLSATLDAFEVRFGNRPEHRPYLDTLRQGLDHLNRLMKDLLDYGRPVQPVLSPVALEPAVRDAIRSAEPLAASTQVRVEVESAPDLPRPCVDAVQLRQMLVNLIENAIQHSPPGGEVRVRLDSMDGLPLARIEVLDQGPGFRPEELEQAFEPFFSRRRGGIGLGLPIVRRLVERVGGRVELGNRAEGGGYARVILPVREGAARDETPQEGVPA